MPKSQHMPESYGVAYLSDEKICHYRACCCNNRRYSRKMGSLERCGGERPNPSPQSDFANITSEKININGYNTIMQKKNLLRVSTDAPKTAANELFLVLLFSLLLSPLAFLIVCNDFDQE